MTTTKTSNIISSLLQSHVPEAYIKTILFPTDFSETAHNAFLYALEMAEALEARLVLLHAYSESLVETHYMPANFVRSLKEKKLQSVLDELETYQRDAQRLTHTNIEVDSMIVEGLPVNAIRKVATEVQADFIVMGTLGAASPSEKTFGSVTAAAIEHAPCPVLAIPREASYKPVNKLLYALQFENMDIEILEKLMSLCQKLGADLNCCHVQTDNEKLDGEALKVFNEVYEIEKEGSISFHLVENNDLVLGLEKFILEQNIDWLVLTMHKERTFDFSFQASLTRSMVLQTDVPLLVYHS